MEAPGNIICHEGNIAQVTDAEVKQKMEKVKGAGIVVKACSPQAISELLNPPDSEKINIALFGATYCDACRPCTEELIKTKKQMDQIGENKYDFWYFPVETAAEPTLKPGDDLGTIVDQFKKCTNGELLTATGWEAEIVPVLLLSGREDKKVWIQTGFLTEQMMERMITAYKKGGSYEDFAIHDLPLKIEELGKMADTLTVSDDKNNYAKWYPLWTTLEIGLELIRNHTTPMVNRDGIKTDEDTAIIPIIPNKTKRENIAHVKLQGKEKDVFLNTLDRACSLTESVIENMRRIAKKEKEDNGEEFPEPDNNYYEKKLNLPRVLRDQLEEIYKPKLETK